MWCFGLCHFPPWWMTVVCVSFASFGASSRVSDGTWPVTGGTSLVRAAGCVGRCRRDGIGPLRSEIPVGCFHVLVSRQSVPRCPCCLCEVLVEEAVLRPLKKL